VEQHAQYRDCHLFALTAEADVQRSYPLQEDINMAKVAIIGAGFAGHTAALYLGDALGKDHEITMINRYHFFSYIPSWVWVGIGRMDAVKTTFPLRPVYARMNVNFVHGKATAVHPDDQFVIVEETDGSGETRVDYDYLLIATGPKLDFAATPGLGPDAGHSFSICTLPHAEQTRDNYLAAVARMKNGEKQKFVIGTGHGSATCQGAAFEYVTNVAKDLIRRGVREQAEILFFSNEPELGDFGVRGVQTKMGDQLLSSEDFMGAALREYDIKWELQKATLRVEKGRIFWEDLNGEQGETSFDFAMLIPRFLGVPMKYIGADGDDVSGQVVNAGGFVIVDGKYGLPWEEMAQDPESWPAVYQNPNYKNIFAAGIAFAPPGSISRPNINPNGLSITPAPPRTGMVSGVIGRIVAKNIIDLIEKGEMTHSERMTEMAAACIASMGDSLWDGSAAVITVYPVVPDHKTYPNDAGRDLFVTDMEMGLAGAWMKRMIHTTFMHKLQGRIGWKLIPE
jgi:sulfide:quinone oxidoreductase